MWILPRGRLWRIHVARPNRELNRRERRTQRMQGIRGNRSNHLPLLSLFPHVQFFILQENSGILPRWHVGLVLRYSWNR